MIVIGLILGLVVYFMLKLNAYEGTIKQFFTTKPTMWAAYISVVTALGMAIGIDWTAVAVHSEVAGVTVYFAYVIAFGLGIGNSSLFFSLFKLKKKTKPETNTPA